MQTARRTRAARREGACRRCRGGRTRCSQRHGAAAGPGAGAGLRGSGPARRQRRSFTRPSRSLPPSLRPFHLPHTIGPLHPHPGALRASGIQRHRHQRALAPARVRRRRRAPSSSPSRAWADYVRCDRKDFTHSPSLNIPLPSLQIVTYIKGELGMSSSSAATFTQARCAMLSRLGQGRPGWRPAPKLDAHMFSVHRSGQARAT